MATAVAPSEQLGTIETNIPARLDRLPWSDWHWKILIGLGTRHLHEETVVWLTTVTPSGAPFPWPVGFVWDGGESVFVYSQPGARIRNIADNPKVTLNCRGDEHGRDIVVLSGTAEVDESRPSAAQDAAWVAKYAAEWKRFRDDGRVIRAALQCPGSDSHQSRSRTLSAHELDCSE